MDEAEKGFWCGLAVGGIAVLLLWLFVANEAEKYKVASGYLTYRSKTYSVVLYDTLDVPRDEQ